MKYNPEIHHRRSIRRKGYDYSQAGFYFITICVQDKLQIFGRIENGKMLLNDAGKMIVKWYEKLPSKFPDICCHEMVVMPDHFHCVIENLGANVGANPPVGANPSVRPTPEDTEGLLNIPLENLESDDISYSDDTFGVSDPEALGEHVGSPLARIVQWFKTMTTNEYIRGVKNLDWQRFNGKLWQRNYWESIIKHKNHFDNVCRYIRNNPAKR